MYWMMLPRWILPNDILQVIKVVYFVKAGNGAARFSD